MDTVLRLAALCLLGALLAALPLLRAVLDMLLELMG